LETRKNNNKLVKIKILKKYKLVVKGHQLVFLKRYRMIKIFRFSIHSNDNPAPSILIIDVLSVFSFFPEWIPRPVPILFLCIMAHI
jgi:hypothetical protein